MFKDSENFENRTDIHPTNFGADPGVVGKIVDKRNDRAARRKRARDFAAAQAERPIEIDGIGRELRALRTYDPTKPRWEGKGKPPMTAKRTAAIRDKRRFESLAEFFARCLLPPKRKPNEPWRPHALVEAYASGELEGLVHLRALLDALPVDVVLQLTRADRRVLLRLAQTYARFRDIAGVVIAHSEFGEVCLQSERQVRRSLHHLRELALVELEPWFAPDQAVHNQRGNGVALSASLVALARGTVAESSTPVQEPTDREAGQKMAKQSGTDSGLEHELPDLVAPAARNAEAAPAPSFVHELMPGHAAPGESTGLPRDTRRDRPVARQDESSDVSGTAPDGDGFVKPGELALACAAVDDPELQELAAWLQPRDQPSRCAKCPADVAPGARLCMACAAAELAEHAAARMAAKGGAS